MLISARACNPSIWRHKTLPKTIALCVDDFGIKYTNPDHDNHLVNTLNKYQKYLSIGKETITVDLLQIGITIKNVDVSMPGYVAKAVHKFQHPQPKQAQHALHECTIPAHDPKVKCTQDEPDLT